MPSVHDRFTLVSDFELRGDQARAIDELTDGLERGDRHQVLLGVTGSGKTFTMAKVIARVNRPTLVMAHNKTLAAQLYQEFRRFFPDNAVEYFVSYYDYYQPEAYVPATDSYIEKEATINDEIDRMRLSATRSLFERRDVIIVASVSCIYGLGSPEAYYGMLLPLERGQRIARERDPAQAGRDPVRAQRPRLQPRHLPRPRRRHRGLSRPTRSIGAAHRALRRRDRRARVVRSAAPARCSGATTGSPIYPKSHFVTPHERREAGRRDASRPSSPSGTKDLEERGQAARGAAAAPADDVRPRDDAGDRLLPRHRELLAAPLRPAPGEPPPTLLDYLPADALIVIDESHQTVPQIRGMYHGDRSRKEVLVDYGFRLPSALDNRPLTFEEWRGARRPGRSTCRRRPGPYELDEGRRRGRRADHPADRPDRSADRGAAGQGPGRRPAGGDPRAGRAERARAGDDADQADGRGPDAVLPGARRAGALPALGHRDARARSRFCATCGAASSTCSSASTCCAKGSICRRCRSSRFSTPTRKASCGRRGSLIQTIGRAARNVNGRAILYADTVTDSMRRAIERDRPPARRSRRPTTRSTASRPTSIVKQIDDVLSSVYERDYLTVPLARRARGVPHPGRAARRDRAHGGGDEGRGRQPRLRAGGLAPRSGPEAAQPPPRRRGGRGGVIVDKAQARAARGPGVRRACAAPWRGARSRARSTSATSSSSSTPSASGRSPSCC